MDRICKDCDPNKKPPRPIATDKKGKPVPGPRCVTHHREFNRSRKRVNHRKSIARKYGDPWGDLYDELKDWQGGVCWICRRATGAFKNLALDHDHDCCPTLPACGRCARGLLCSQCNLTVLGRLDQQALQRAIDYLNDPPAKRFLAERALNGDLKPPNPHPATG